MCPESRGLVKIVLVGSLPASVTLLAACPASTHIEAWSEAPVDGSPLWNLTFIWDL